MKYLMSRNHGDGGRARIARDHSVPTGDRGVCAAVQTGVEQETLTI
ncbi:hypothetical protein [Streptomyces sediminimaris]